MKPKASLTRALVFVCAMWFLTPAAQAFYNPSTGRWLSRDPIQEDGGNNVYRLTCNHPIDQVDVLGLFTELWYGNHPVEVFGRIQGHHSKLWLITDEADLLSDRRFAFKPLFTKTEFAHDEFVGPCQMFGITMGAGPDRPVDKDELIASFNRPTDVILPLGNPSLIDSFTTPTEALNFLFTVSRMNANMNRNFQNTTLEYELFPTPTYRGDGWDEFNSNSYISGLLNAFRYTAPAPGANVPGYRKPIPRFVFTKLFANTEQLKAEWRRHFPGF